MKNAETQFQEAVKAQPQSADAQFGLALALIESHDAQVAVASLNETLQQDPLQFEALTRLAIVRFF